MIELELHQVRHVVLAQGELGAHVGAQQLHLVDIRLLRVGVVGLMGLIGVVVWCRGGLVQIMV